jgi:ESS family glutamate:Na+ symporter
VRFWDVGIVTNLLAVMAILAVGSVIVRITPTLRRLAVPPAIVAGVVGLLLGPSAAGVLPTDPEILEVIVYHSFAIVFIAVGLQAGRAGAPRAAAARSFAVAIPTFAVGQALLGFALVLAWWVTTSVQLHPGFALMIPLGFSQGPGQALSLGGAWEPHGLTDGAQIGLAFAAMGFAYCVVMGIPLVAFARRRGWLDQERIADPAPGHPEAAPSLHRAAGVFEPLSTQVVLIGGVYLGVYGVLWLVSRPIPADHPLQATVWGFHFIVGAGLAIATRSIARRAKWEAAFDDDLLARLSVVAVDVTTATAIAAVQLEVISRWLGPLLVFSLVAGVTTLLGAAWLSRRAFPEAPFGHGLALFGLATGTISTGLALLRMIDPELRGPTARNVVLGAAASVPLMAPLFVVVIPFSVSRWPDGWGPSLLWPTVALSLYAVALVVAWWKLTPIRVLRPLRSLWPPDP